MRSKRGFTLIELLIVVAIIAILAAIAVPNFLEAQVRSKVSRVKADMRSTATAIESYAVDNNRYPPHGFLPPIADPGGVFPNGSQTLSQIITTPLAYLTSLASTAEPFTEKNVNDPNPLVVFIRTHIQYAAFQEPWGTQAARSFATGRYGIWRFTSAGPDRQYFNGALNQNPIVFSVITYDPTNGTVSVGDIFRTHLDADYKREQHL